MKHLYATVPLVLAVLLVTTVFAKQKETAVSTTNQTNAPADKTTSIGQDSPAAAISDDSALPPSGVIDSNDPLLQPPPLPAGKPTLVGGIVGKIDRVKNFVVVKPFGGGAMKVYFDERTHIYRNGAETTELGIRKGDRVYVDTLSDGDHILAENIRINDQLHPADARGQLLSYDPRAGRIEVRDDLTSQAITFEVKGNTVIRHGDQPASTADLVPGSLLDVEFVPASAGKGIARQIRIYAVPGATFTFAGKVTFLDMRNGMLALENATDHRSYEVHFRPGDSQYRAVRIGSAVSIQAEFDGKNYKARSLSVVERTSE